MAADVDSLFALADNLLTIAGQALATTDAGAPDVQCLTPASPAFDCCTALFVQAAALSEEPTSPLAPLPATGQRDRFGRINMATFVIWALRCAPTVQKDGSVLIADNTAVTKAVLQDAWALWNGITCAIKNGTFEGLCNYVHIQQSISVQEQGGCVGWQFSLRAEIDGIVCEPGT